MSSGETKEWVQGFSPEGYTYYYNTITGGECGPDASILSKMEFSIFPYSSLLLMFIDN